MESIKREARQKLQRLLDRNIIDKGTVLEIKAYIFTSAQILWTS